MGGFMGIGNSSQKTDRGRSLAGWQEEWTNLREARANYDKLFPQAQAQSQAGATGMGTASDFWRNILTSRTGAQAAVAPEINNIAAQSDAARTAAATLGTSRGGGVAAANQNRAQQVATAQNNAILQARPQAAQQLQQVSQAQASAAAQQLSQALQALGLSSEIADRIVRTSMESRMQSDQINKGVVGQWTGLAANLLGLANPASVLGKAGRVAGSL